MPITRHRLKRKGRKSAYFHETIIVKRIIAVDVVTRYPYITGRNKDIQA